MVIHVNGAKGRKDCDVMLSPKLLECYLRGLRRPPKLWLFSGNRWHTGKRPITSKVIWAACREAAKRAGLGSEIHPHTLRHASAYYTTFQSSFILKAIALGQAQSAAVYGRNGRLARMPERLVSRDPLNR